MASDGLVLLIKDPCIFLLCHSSYDVSPLSSGLSKLHCLIKLSLDGNQLTALDASVLGHLSKLSFLSVENNSIRSLHGIQRARSLLELYLGYNQICRSRDIYCMKVNGRRLEKRPFGFRSAI